jgi:sulfonate transport system permease protein
MTEQVQELPAVAPVENTGSTLAGFAVNVAKRLVPWLVPVGLIVFWQIASSLGWLSTRVLPAPVDVVKAAWTLTASGELWTHVKVSAGRALAGLAIGGGAGLALGMMSV